MCHWFDILKIRKVMFLSIITFKKYNNRRNHFIRSLYMNRCIFLKNVSDVISSALSRNEFMIGYTLINLADLLKFRKTKTYWWIIIISYILYALWCSVRGTKRKLKTRLNDRVKNIRLDSQKHSVISDHIFDHDHSMNWENVKILDFEPKYHKRLISEMIHNVK